MSPSTLRSPPYSLRDLHHTLGLGVSQIPQEKPSKIAQNNISTISVQGPHAQRGLKARAQRGLKIPHIDQRWARAQHGLNMPRSARTPQAPRFQNFTRAQRGPLVTLSVSALKAPIPEIWSRSAWTKLTTLSVGQISALPGLKLPRARHGLKAHAQCEA